MTPPPEMRGLAARRVLCAALVTVIVVGSGCGSDGDDTEPTWCDSIGTFDAACDGAHCVAGIIVDYKRVAPRGFWITELSGEAVSPKKAEQIAKDHLTEVLKLAAPNSTDCEQEDDFVHCGLVYPGQDRYLVVIHQPTGTVLVAEPELWAHPEKRGYDFPLPNGFTNALPIGCVPPITPPKRKKSVVTGFPLGTAVASTPDDALEVVLGLNVTRAFVGNRAYRAFTISHAPALGEFDAESADWHVWLSIEPQ